MLEKNLAGMDGDVESSEVLYISSKGQAKMTLHNEKSHIDAEHYGAIHLMFDTLRAPGHNVSVMMLTVELKRITGTPVSLHVLSQCVACWLVSVGIVQCCITHVVQNTWHCEIVMQDFTNYINNHLVLGQYRQDCVVNIDETNISFDMDGGLTLADKGDKTVSLKTTGTSMRCTVLLGVTMNEEKLTPLVVSRASQTGGLLGILVGRQLQSGMSVKTKHCGWITESLRIGLIRYWLPLLLKKGIKHTS